MQLHIPKPCTASWEDMTPDEHGRHCATCAKTVVDFTTMTDEQVVQFLGTAPISLCARMTGAQTQRELALSLPEPWLRPRPAQGPRFLPYGLWALFALLAGMAGCDRRRLTGKIAAVPILATIDMTEPVLTGVVTRAPRTYTACLTVTDKGDHPLAGALVVINGRKGFVTTNELGKANVLFPDGVDKIVVQVTAVGYVPRTISIRQNGHYGEDPYFHLKVQMDEVLMGDTINPVQRINPG